MAVWINGTLVPDDEARISVFDHGLVTGDGVFETIKVVGGVPFALSRHLAGSPGLRTGLGLSTPDLEQIRDGAMAVIDSSSKPELARMRITVTGGIAPLGSERGASGAGLTAIVPWPRAKAPRPGSMW